MAPACATPSASTRTAPSPPRLTATGCDKGQQRPQRLRPTSADRPTGSSNSSWLGLMRSRTRGDSGVHQRAGESMATFAPTTARAPRRPRRQSGRTPGARPLIHPAAAAAPPIDRRRVSTCDCRRHRPEWVTLIRPVRLDLLAMISRRVPGVDTLVAHTLPHRAVPALGDPRDRRRATPTVSGSVGTAPATSVDAFCLRGRSGCSSRGSLRRARGWAPIDAVDAPGSG